VNAAAIIGGPAIVTFRGATFYSKGDIELEASHETFDLETSLYGRVGMRSKQSGIKVSFTPVGEWENLSVLWPHASTAAGTLIAPDSLPVASIDLDTDVFTVTAHGLSTATAVMLHAAITLPTTSPQVDASTIYFVRSTGDNTLTLHPTAADATNDTSKITVSAAGTGTLYFDVERPLVVHSLSGDCKLTLHNAAVTKMPDLTFKATEQPIGQVEFEGFLRQGYEPGDTNAYYTITTEALADATFDPDDIITKPAILKFGATAYETKDGAKLSFEMETEDVVIDRLGPVSKRFKSAKVSARSTPMGITETALLTLLEIQANFPGADLPVGALDIYDDAASPTYYARVYAALLRSGKITFGLGADRIGELEFNSARSITAGVADPLWYLGTEAPA